MRAGREFRRTIGGLPRALYLHLPRLHRSVQGAPGKPPTRIIVPSPVRSSETPENNGEQAYVVIELDLAKQATRADGTSV